MSTVSRVRGEQFGSGCLMHCPYCAHTETKVVDSRLTDDGATVRRRRACLSCHERYTTRELMDRDMPRVVKSDGRCCQFDENKMRRGLEKALEKRPVAAALIDRSVQRIIQAIQTRGNRDIQSSAIGDLVMDELRSLDAVAYVRFASVYRSFQDVSEFQSEIDRLKILNEEP